MKVDNLSLTPKGKKSRTFYVRMKPEKKFGFAIVNNELGDFDILHYFKLKGYGYKSACKEAFTPNALIRLSMILRACSTA